MAKNWLRSYQMITVFRKFFSVAVLIGVALAPVAAMSAAPAQVPAAPVADDYIIGHGDNLEVVVSGLAELSRLVIVRPDGKISTPDVEDMVARGKSPAELARDVEAALIEQGVRNPKVTVIVASARSTFSQVKVMGQVRNPKSIPFYEGLRVSDLILEAGGTTDFAAPNRAYVSRKVSGKDVKLPVRLGDLINKGDVKHDLELRPGDTLFVPMSWL
jgi:polysaccharide export outer membrane protein